MNDISDDQMSVILDRVRQLVADLRALGIEWVQLEAGYVFTSGTTKRHYAHSGRTIRAYQHKGIKLVVATKKDVTL